MANSRRTHSEIKYNEQTYIEGTAVRRLAAEPARESSKTGMAPEVSKVAHKNRQKAKQMNLAYVLFLTVTSVVTLFLCVQFVQLKSQLTAQMASVARKETELSVLKADNDAFDNSVAASGDLEYIKEVATNQLGMRYPSEGQIISFNTAGNSYVRQYQDVPEAK